ncbi:MAG: hypothetical protein KJ957_06250 [Candidatus Omnitrophica bacterium]|nr:hypothetical protein [Candidatus Omnitrophota bacterium]
MKKLIGCILVIAVICSIGSPLWAAGDKNRNTKCSREQTRKGEQKGEQKGECQQTREENQKENRNRNGQ